MMQQLLKNFSLSVVNLLRIMSQRLEEMWASKLGLEDYNDSIVAELLGLMEASQVDYTMLFQQLSEIPEAFSALHNCFASDSAVFQQDELKQRWVKWFNAWRQSIAASTAEELAALRQQLKRVKSALHLARMVNRTGISGC